MTTKHSCVGKTLKYGLSKLNVELIVGRSTSAAGAKAPKRFEISFGCPVNIYVK